MQGPSPESVPEPSARVEVDLGALAQNLATFRARAAGVEILPVVKADAYGHGVLECSKRLIRDGVRRLSVARLEEAMSLRDAGIEVEILILGPSRVEEVGAYERSGITPILSSLEQVRFWAHTARGGHGVHLKVDTGMQRLGIPLDEIGRALELVRRAPGIALAGFCSHLAEGENPSSERNATQMQAFAGALGLLRDEERSSALVHLGAGSAALHLPDAHYNALRVGLGLFGYDSARIDRALVPAMRVVGRLLDVRSVPEGARVGYDGTWTAGRDSRLGVLGIGYADGLPRALSNRGEALVRGRRVPIVGRISMDLTLVDVTDVEAEHFDPCVLLGEQGGERIDANELADALGTISYEIVCRFGAMRLPRRYSGEVESA